MTQEMISAELLMDINSKPTRWLRLILGLYSGFVGLISIFIIPMGWYYYSFGSIDLLELELNLQNITLVSINIVFGYALLPKFMSQGRYNPGRAILGGAITFVIAQIIRSFIAGYLMSDTENFFLLITQLSFLLETLIPLFTFALVVAIVIGGGAVWLINKLLYSNPSFIGSTHTSLWTEALSTKLLKIYIPSKLNPTETTHNFRMITATYCGSIGILIPAILMMIFLIVEDQSFDLERDLDLKIFILIPGCLFFGFTLIPRFLDYGVYRSKKAFLGGMLALGLTSLITIIGYTLYSLPIEEIKSWMTSELTLFLSVKLPVATVLILVSSLVGGLITWLGYRMLFNRQMTKPQQSWSVFE